MLGWPLHVYSGDYGHIYISSQDYPNLRIECIHRHYVSDQEWEQNDVSTNDINIEKVISTHRDTGWPVYIAKQLESYNLMRPYIDYIRNLYHRILPKIDRIAIHMRFGDLAHVNGKLNETYIRFACDVVSRNPSKPVLIVSEDSSNQWTRDMQMAIAKQCHTMVEIKHTQSGSYQEDSDCLSSSTILVVTNSTFSWWAAMLSEHASEVNVFLHPEQFCSSMHNELIYPVACLPSHWRCNRYDTAS